MTRTVTYYPAGGAMRINSTLYYILKDHLGSASVVTNSTGVVVGEQRYYPYGETRFTTGTIYTDRLFTGQQEITGLGIYNYGARFYSPKLGRFLSADTIVPGATNPQDLNRYSYVRNNPLRYVDPSGHLPRGCGPDNIYCGGLPENGGVSLPIPGSGNSGGDDGGGGGGDDDEPDDGHYYTLTNVVCPAVFNCTEDEMQEYATRFQYPGQNSLFPVRDGSIRFVAPAPQLALHFINISPASLLFLLSGAIRVTTSDDGLTLVNQTLPTHIFHNGRVERAYSQRDDGAWIVTTIGSGTNVWPVIGSTIDQANNTVGSTVFENVDTQMLQYITLDQQVPWILP